MQHASQCQNWEETAAGPVHLQKLELKAVLPPPPPTSPGYPGSAQLGYQIVCRPTLHIKQIKQNSTIKSLSSHAMLAASWCVQTSSLELSFRTPTLHYESPFFPANSICQLVARGLVQWFLDTSDCWRMFCMALSSFATLLLSSSRLQLVSSESSSYW